MHVKLPLLKKLKFCEKHVDRYVENFQHLEEEIGLEVNEQTVLAGYDMKINIWVFFAQVFKYYKNRKAMRDFANWCAEQISHLLPKDPWEIDPERPGFYAGEPETSQKLRATSAKNSINLPEVDAFYLNSRLMIECLMAEKGLTEREIVKLQIPKLIELLNKIELLEKKDAKK